MTTKEAEVIAEYTDLIAKGLSQRDRYREALEKIKALGPRCSRLDAIEIATEVLK